MEKTEKRKGWQQWQPYTCACIVKIDNGKSGDFGNYAESEKMFKKRLKFLKRRK